MPTPRLFALAVLASVGLSGATLTVLGMNTPLTDPFTLLFLLTGPALATWPLLPRLTPAARAIVSGTMVLVVNMTVAQVMLSFDAWSPRTGVAAVMGICGVMALLDVVLTRRALLSTEPEMPPADIEDWLFEG